DDISGKNILVIGTGNLASKIALRTAERQANVYIHGRSDAKEQTIINGINAFLPQFTTPVKTMEEWDDDVKKFDIVISFLSGPYWAEESLLPNVNKDTLIIDGGISNFSSDFIQQLLANDMMIVRLDVRFALAYQFMATMNDSMAFYKRFLEKHMLEIIVSLQADISVRKDRLLLIKSTYQLKLSELLMEEVE